MQSLLLAALATLGLAQEPPLQIPPPPVAAPAQTPAPTPAPALPSSATAPAPNPLVAAAPPVTAAPLAFYSESFAYSWDRTIPLSINLDGLRVSSIFFNKRTLQPGFFNLMKGAEFGTRAQIEVTNTGKFPKVPGFSVAVLDKNGRLLGVASGGTKVGTVEPGETETFDLNFTQVKERLPFGDKFLLAIELRD
jgi:hypothetical protein